jgi:hypothetical protein
MKNIKTALIFIFISTSLAQLKSGQDIIHNTLRNPFHKLCSEQKIDVPLIRELVRSYIKQCRRLELIKTLNQKNNEGYTALDILITTKHFDIEEAYLAMQILIQNDAATSSKKIINDFLKIYECKKLKKLLSNAHAIYREDLNLSQITS